MALGRELPHSFRDALNSARRILSTRLDLVEKNLVETEAEQIVMAASGFESRLELFSRQNDRMPKEAAEKTIVLAMGRAEGRILQHLIGFQHFLGHRYEVSPEVLVPRPETEFLVVTAIERLKAWGRIPNIGVEIGLGSGAISIELLQAFPKLRMVASELSEKAEKVALRNFERICGQEAVKAKRLQVRRAMDPRHVWEPFGVNDHGEFLISNPPYLLQEDPVDEDVARHEPAEALYAPAEDALHFYRKIAERGPRRLLAGAYAFLEMPAFRAVVIAKLFVDKGWEVEIVRDLAGRDRVLIARKPEIGEID